MANSWLKKKETEPSDLSVFRTLNQKVTPAEAEAVSKPKRKPWDSDVAWFLQEEHVSRGQVSSWENTLPWKQNFSHPSAPRPLTLFLVLPSSSFQGDESDKVNDRLLEYSCIIINSCINMQCRNLGFNKLKGLLEGLGLEGGGCSFPQMRDQKSEQRSGSAELEALSSHGPAS